MDQEEPSTSEPSAKKPRSAEGGENSLINGTAALEETREIGAGGSSRNGEIKTEGKFLGVCAFGMEEEEDDLEPDVEWDEANDDEATLNEDENCEETNENEVIELQEEGDLPIEQLLQRYGYPAPDSTTTVCPSTSSGAAGTSSASSRSARRERRARQRQETAEAEEEKPVADHEGIVSSSTYQESTFLPSPHESNVDSGLQEPETGQKHECALRPEGPPVAEVEEETSTQGSWSSSETGQGVEAGPTSLAYVIEMAAEEDSDEDDDYVPPEVWKKEPRVGPEFQVAPETLPNPDYHSAESSKEELLWRPEVLPESQVEEYLKRFFEVMHKWREAGPPELDGDTAPSALNEGWPELPDIDTSLRDDDIALALLVESEFKTDLALSRQWQFVTELPRRAVENRSLLATAPDERVRALEGMLGALNSNHQSSSVSDEWIDRIWSHESASLFEEGLKLYGKNFRAIKERFFPNRSVGDLVEYYYLWKKTERHDMFVQRVRFEKNRYAFNPNTTDYMENFIQQMDKEHNPGATVVTVAHPFLEASDGHGVADASHPKHFPGASPTHFASSLISSDPKHAAGMSHATHFNEWQGVGEGEHEGVHGPFGTLPHLDSEVVEEILET